MHFAYFQDLIINVPTNCENYLKPVVACGNYVLKCPNISKNRVPLLLHTVLLNKSYYKMILYHLPKVIGLKCVSFAKCPTPVDFSYSPFVFFMAPIVFTVHNYFLPCIRPPFYLSGNKIT